MNMNEKVLKYWKTQSVPKFGLRNCKMLGEVFIFNPKLQFKPLENTFLTVGLKSKKVGKFDYSHDLREILSSGNLISDKLCLTPTFVGAILEYPILYDIENDDSSSNWLNNETLIVKKLTLNGYIISSFSYPKIFENEVRNHISEWENKITAEICVKTEETILPNVML